MITPALTPDAFMAQQKAPSSPALTPDSFMAQQKQPSVWDVLTQPTEKTDKEFMGYRGPAGVAGATVKGLNDVARGTQAAVKGAWDTLAPPKDTTESLIDAIPAALPIYRTVKGLVTTGKQAAQVPAAIHDINQSPDPLTHYAQAAQDTASQGAGQALTALGTEGIARFAPKVIETLPSAAAAPVRFAARGVEAAVNSKLKPALKLFTPADEAVASTIKIPGRDLGLKQPTYPGAPLPEATPEMQSDAAAKALPAAFQPVPTKAPPVPGTVDQPFQSSAEPVRQSPELPAAFQPLPPKAPPVPGTVDAPFKSGEIGQRFNQASQPQSAPPQLPPGDKGLQNLLNDSLGGKPLQPNVPLKNQLPAHGEYMQRFKAVGAQSGAEPGAQAPAPTAEPEHMGQFARANGLELHQAIPETVAGDVLRAKIHDLTNVQVRQLAINAGEDMGQQAVTNAKNAGGVTRQAVLSRILAKHTPEEIGQMIDEGQHLPPATSPSGPPLFSASENGVPAVRRGSIASALAGRNGR